MRQVWHILQMLWMSASLCRDDDAWMGPESPSRNTRPRNDPIWLPNEVQVTKLPSLFVFPSVLLSPQKSLPKDAPQDTAPHWCSTRAASNGRSSLTVFRGNRCCINYIWTYRGLSIRW
jgi:hypothetical protein